MSEHLRRAACPHAAVMVRWLTGGGLRAARPTEAYFAVRRGGALPLPRATARVAPTEGYRSAVGRADVGSELSAASGRSSEVSEWPRSKFLAFAVRQHKNLGHRNRIIGPYGPLGGWCGGPMWASAPTKALQGVRSASGGRGRTPPLRRGCKECDAVRNPPVTASPRQPPLGKGAEGTGVRIATASVRTGFAMTGCLQGVRCAAGHMGPALQPNIL